MAGFKDRTEAGRQLADELSDYADRDDVIVLGLPRGGVPVAYEVAMELNVPLDIYLVRKLGTPGREELAMGAIASGGVRVINQDVIDTLGIDRDTIESVAEREREELQRREALYRGDRERPSLEGKTVILVDDGLATGATMRAAVDAVREENPSKVVVAVGTAPPETKRDFEAEVDEIVCILTPRPFLGVGGSYRDFSQTTDDEVRELLEEAWERDL